MYELSIIFNGPDLDPEAITDYYRCKPSRQGKKMMET